MRVEGLRWGWIGIGAAIVLAAQVASGLTIMPVIIGKYMQGREDRLVWLGIGLLFAVGSAIYFAGGLVVGRLSPGRTAKEPAVASVLAALLGWALAPADAPSPGLIGLAFCAGFGALGGCVGVRLQNRARGTRPGC